MITVKANKEDVWEGVRGLFGCLTKKPVKDIEGIEVWKELYNEAKKDLIPLFGEDGRISITISDDFSNTSKEDISNVLLGFEKMINTLCAKEKFASSVGVDKGKNAFLFFENMARTCFTPVEVASNRLSSKRIDPSNLEKYLPAETKLSKYLQAYISSWQASDFFLNSYPISCNQDISDFVIDLYANLVSSLKGRECTIVLSINPLDILLSSIHTANWRSCHNIIDGERRCGPISYLFDDVTCIAYAYSGKKDFVLKSIVSNEGLTIEDYPVKIWRQMVYISPSGNFSMHSREYPSSMPGISKTCQSHAAGVLSKLSTTSKDVNNFKSIVSNNYYLDTSAWHYKDGLASILVSNDFGGVPKLKNGADSIPCPMCGGLRSDKNNYTEYLCPDCRTNVKHSCFKCSSKMLKKDLYFLDGQWICKACYEEIMNVCHYCDEDFKKEEIIKIGDSLFCKSCSSRFSVCPTCSKAILKGQACVCADRIVEEVLI